jgi:hypothetical protein
MTSGQWVSEMQMRKDKTVLGQVNIQKRRHE